MPARFASAGLCFVLSRIQSVCLPGPLSTDRSAGHPSRLRAITLETTMKKIALAASVLTLIASPAFAQSTQTVTVNGSVAKQCGLGNQSGGGSGGHTPTVTMNNITDGNGFLNTNASVNIGFGNVWCNGPASLSLAPTSFANDTPVTDANSFVNKLDMIVDGGETPARSILVYFGGGVATTAAPKTFSIPQEFETGTGDFQTARVRLALPSGTAGNDRPIAGAYSGSVILTVSPS